MGMFIQQLQHIAYKILPHEAELFGAFYAFKAWSAAVITVMYVISRCIWQRYDVNHFVIKCNLQSIRW